MSDLFTALKENISALAAADRYGIEHNRQGMARCIFHNERTASMKIYPGTSRDRHSGFCCFGCGKTGSVIDMVAQYKGISARDAALMMAGAFGISYDDWEPGHQPAAPKINPAKQFEQDVIYWLRVVTDLQQICSTELEESFMALENNASEEQEKKCSDLCDLVSRLEGLSEILTEGSLTDKMRLIVGGKEELRCYGRKLSEYTGRASAAI